MDTEYTVDTPSVGLHSIELSTDEINLVQEALGYSYNEGYLMGNEEMATSISERLDDALFDASDEQDDTALLEDVDPVQAVVSVSSL